MSIISWLLTSSENPDKVGMTVRGILIVLVPLIAHWFGLGEDESNALVETLVQLVVASMTLIGVAMTAFGLLRKLFNQRWSHPNA